jgi:hypothetical protein
MKRTIGSEEVDETEWQYEGVVETEKVADRYSEDCVGKLQEAKNKLRGLHQCCRRIKSSPGGTKTRLNGRGGNLEYEG